MSYDSAASGETVISATCVHEDGTEHPAPWKLIWDSVQQRWVRMYWSCHYVLVSIRDMC